MKVMISRCMLLTVVSIASLFTNSAAKAGFVFFTNLNAFNAASSTSIAEDFEAFSPKDTPLSSFVSNGNTYTALGGGTANVFVISSGATNFGVPATASAVLTSNGNEDFRVDFGSVLTAVGFDTYLNSFGPATIEVLGSNGQLESFTLNHDPTTVGFFGVISDVSITSVRWTTVNGAAINTGIDNLRLGLSTVPEPSSLLFASMGGLCLLGAFLRRRKQAN